MLTHKNINDWHLYQKYQMFCFYKISDFLKLILFYWRFIQCWAASRLTGRHSEVCLACWTAICQLKWSTWLHMDFHFFPGFVWPKKSIYYIPKEISLNISNGISRECLHTWTEKPSYARLKSSAGTGQHRQSHGESWGGWSLLDLCA